jgi:branched-chain amino acid transport system permease protein
MLRQPLAMRGVMSTAEATPNTAPTLPGWVMPLAKTVGVMAAIAALITLLVQSGIAPRGTLLYKVLADPFVSMWEMPDLFAQTIWEGLVAGVLYALIALGFVLIYKASGVFNFAQGIMVVFAALTLVGSYEIMTQRLGLPPGTVVAMMAVVISLAVLWVLAVVVERVVLRPLVNQHEIIMLMATVGLTYFLIGFGEYVFGGNPKVMITAQLGLPTGQTTLNILGGRVNIQHLDVAAAVIATVMIVFLALFFQKTRIGRALRAVADSHKAALSVGISLNQIWVIVWFTAGIVALVTGIMWGARSDVSFALEIIALKALPVLILGGFTSVPGAIVGGLIIGVGEKLGEFYWGPLFGGGIETWLAYFIALGFLVFRPQGLFGEKIIERI